jgi:hypothetical protein
MRRAASAVAVLGVLAGVAGVVIAARIVRTNGGIGAPALWMIVPIVAGSLTALATLTGSVAFVWTSIGVVWGFAVLAALSFGIFFLLEAPILAGAGLLHAATIAPRWKLLTVPLWFAAGAGAMGSTFLLRNALFNATHGCVSGPGYASCESVTYSDVMIWSASLLLAALYGVARARRR